MAKYETLELNSYTLLLRFTISTYHVYRWKGKDIYIYIYMYINGKVFTSTTPWEPKN